MATIALYADKVSQMTGLIAGVKQSVIDYKAELTALRTKAMSTNSSVCNMDDVIASIKASTEIQDRKIKTLETIQTNVVEFVTDAVRIDNDVADLINRRKDEFYKKFSHLKPDSEISGWDRFVNGCKKAVEWCRDNWKLIAAVALVVVAVVAIVALTVISGGTLGPLMAVLVKVALGASKGLIVGALVGGIMGGVTSAVTGGSVLQGIGDGAFSGALTGALFGGLGGAGQAFGQALGSSCRAFSAIRATSFVSNGLSYSMDGYELLAFGAGLIWADNAFTAFNQKLQSSEAYTKFRFWTDAVAAFSGSAHNTMKPMERTCFVAGTKVLTASGMVAIEDIKAGDRVISTNVETGETVEKRVVETYIRKSTRLVHIWVDGKVTKATPEHPYWLPNRGWVEAGDLSSGDQLRKPDGALVAVQKVMHETLDAPVDVYNFQVEDFHAYYAGDISVLVHNAKYNQGDVIPDSITETKPKHSPNPNKWLDRGKTIEVEDGTWTYTNLEDISITYKNGHPDFKGAGMTVQEVNIGEVENYSADFRTANELTGGLKDPINNTWHHSEEVGILQEVNKSINREFTHRGGMSISKQGE